MVSTLFAKPLLSYGPTTVFDVKRLTVPDSAASVHPSPSESKSNRFGMPSLSVSISKLQDAYTAKPPVPDVEEPPMMLKLNSEIPTVDAPGISFNCTIPHDWVVPVLGLVVLK